MAELHQETKTVMQLQDTFFVNLIQFEFKFQTEITLLLQSLPSSLAKWVFIKCYIDSHNLYQPCISYICWSSDRPLMYLPLFPHVRKTDVNVKNCDSCPCRSRIKV